MSLSKCTVPCCEVMISSGSDLSLHLGSTRLFRPVNKCNHCQEFVYHANNTSDITKHKKVHSEETCQETIDYSKVDQFSNPLLFANKRSSLLPSLERPISDMLHKLMKDTNIYNNEILSAVTKSLLLFLNSKFSISTSENSSPSSTLKFIDLFYMICNKNKKNLLLFVL